jgi:hypothetical protein
MTEDFRMLDSSVYKVSIADRFSAVNGRHAMDVHHPTILGVIQDTNSARTIVQRFTVNM